MDDVQKSKLAIVGRWIFGLGAVLLIAPYVFLMVKGIVGLVLAVAIGLTVIRLAPWFSDVLSNLALKLIIGEARKNPIETMLNLEKQNAQIIASKDDKIVDFEGRLGDYHDKMTVFAKRYPEEAPQYQQVEDTMRRALTLMKQKQQAAKSAQREYHMKIEKAQAIYSMATAAADVTKSARSVEQQAFAKIKEQVAFDEVNHSFNSAVAALSLEVDNQEDVPSLPSGWDATEVSTGKRIPATVERS